MAHPLANIELEYDRPPVTSYQRGFMDCDERFAIIEASTKVGKTASMIIWLFEQALQGSDGQNFWWVAPVYAQAEIAFNRMKRQVNVADFFIENKSALSLILPNGAIIWFKSAKNPDDLYGDDVVAAVFDEFTRAKELAWIALRSTLTATRGKCKFIGNVRGRGWGYKLAQKAKSSDDPNYRHFKITAWDAVMTGKLDPKEVEAAKGEIVGDDAERMEHVYAQLINYAYSDLSQLGGQPILELDEILQAKRDLVDYVFRELYEAEASDDGTNPFGQKNIDAAKRNGLAEGPPVCFGIDLAKRRDWTVIIGLNANKEVCYFERFRRSWNQTTAFIKTLPDLNMEIDRTGVGDPIVESIQEGRENAQGFNFTGSSKQLLVEDLVAAFQQGETTFPKDTPIEDELLSIEFTHTTNGTRYSAPEGLYDDCVMSYALAYRAYRTRPKPMNTAKASRPEGKAPQKW